MRKVLVLCGALALGGCLGTAQTQVVLSQAQTVLNSAQATLTGYGIVKGMALVAEAADPVLAAPLSAALAVTDGYAAKLQAAVSAGTLDLAAIQVLIAQINTQVAAIQTQAAPAIKVIPSAPAAAVVGKPLS